MADEPVGAGATPIPGSAPSAATDPAPSAAPAPAAGEPSILNPTPEKPEDKPADKPGEKPDAKGEAPATVDPKAFKLPEGFSPDEKMLGDFATLANEHKLPQDAAQKLVDLHAAALKQASEASSKYWADKNTEWVGEVKAEFGVDAGKNPKIIAVTKMIDSLGEKPASDFKAALDFSGMGNNPAIIRGLAALAERLTEPAHAKGAPPGRPATAAQAIYPNMKQN